MDKIEYICLLSDVFIKDIMKFIFINIERLKICGWFFKYYYFLL